MRILIALAAAALAAGCAAPAPPPTAAEMAASTTIVLTETDGWQHGDTLTIVMDGDEILETRGDRWSSSATATLGTNAASLQGIVHTNGFGNQLGTLRVFRSDGGISAEISVTGCSTDCTGEFSS